MRSIMTIELHRRIMTLGLVLTHIRVSLQSPEHRSGREVALARRQFLQEIGAGYGLRSARRRKHAGATVAPSVLGSHAAGLGEARRLAEFSALAGSLWVEAAGFAGTGSGGGFGGFEGGGRARWWGVGVLHDEVGATA